jgi:hypothetical protein
MKVKQTNQDIIKTTKLIFSINNLYGYSNK